MFFMKRKYQSLTNRQVEDFIMEHIRRSNVKYGKLLDYDQILQEYRDSYQYYYVEQAKGTHERPITFLQYMWFERDEQQTKWRQEDDYEEFEEDEYGEEY